jgi:hypothetical protein
VARTQACKTHVADPWGHVPLHHLDIALGRRGLERGAHCLEPFVEELRDVDRGRGDGGDTTVLRGQGTRQCELGIGLGVEATEPPLSLLPADRFATQ